ncbi:hypothetical protein AAU57_06220 [Nonlabens sp. YIK11]|uniref:LIC_10190 family membrane protein n=1 Tax=Nonlabens sp. YIK11 TaxID=1453349 RepID=UPI0006DD27E4|nr:hypothetical protein AAU57_06220 [Nonlabens sp. YIK11]
MIVLLLYFIFLIGVTVPCGLLIQKIMRIQALSLLDLFWLGIALITIMAGVWCLFLPLDFKFVIVLISSVILTIWVCQDMIKLQCSSAKQFISTITTKNLVWVVICTVLVLAAGTLSGYVLDNDSYYLQTIQWLDTHGLVPGIANWHLFLAQQSGFHILESAVNLEFLDLEFNDLGLFITLVMILWSILPSSIGESVFQKAYRNLLAITFPLLLLLGTAPSPDVPVILLSYYVIYKFLFGASEWTNVFMMSVLTAMACYFKITSVLLGIFPLLMIFRLKEDRWRSTLHFCGLGLLFGGLFMAKNIVASGYPLFPLTSVSLDVDWLVPEEMIRFYTDATVAQAYGISFTELNQVDGWQRFLLWIQQAGMEGLMNKGILLVVIASICGAFFYRHKPKIVTVLLVFVSFALIMALSSPQARFFLPFLIPATMVLLLSTLSMARNYSLGIARFAVISGVSILLLPSIIRLSTDNERMKNVPEFELGNLLFPSQRSRYSDAFAKANINNIQYNDPTGDDFFYGTYDVPLPAAQKEYLDYFKTYYQVSPEYRGDTPAEGFRAVKN